MEWESLVMYYPSEHIEWSEIMEEINILDKRSGEIYVLNQTGRIMWNALISCKDEEAIINQITKYLDVHETLLKPSLERFKRNLITKGIIIERKTP